MPTPKNDVGAAIPSKPVDTKNAGEYVMTFDKPTVIDRIAMMENQTNGQVIRSYSVYAKINSTFVDVPKFRSVNVHLCQRF